MPNLCQHLTSLPTIILASGTLHSLCADSIRFLCVPGQALFKHKWSPGNVIGFIRLPSYLQAKSQRSLRTPAQFWIVHCNAMVNMGVHGRRAFDANRVIDFSQWVAGIFSSQRTLLLTYYCCHHNHVKLRMFFCI